MSPVELMFWIRLNFATSIFVYLQFLTDNVKKFSRCGVIASKTFVTLTNYKKNILTYLHTNALCMCQWINHTKSNVYPLELIFKILLHIKGVDKYVSFIFYLIFLKQRIVLYDLNTANELDFPKLCHIFLFSYIIVPDRKHQKFVNEV